MANRKRLKLSVIHDILPQEIIVMVFKKLGCKSLSAARDSCKHWRKVIDDFNLLEPVSSEYQIKTLAFLKQNNH